MTVDSMRMRRITLDLPCMFTTSMARFDSSGAICLYSLIDCSKGGKLESG